MLIVVFLKNIFKLYYYKKIIVENKLKIAGIEYFSDINSMENNGFIGFFDWLRINRSTIVGIRVSYFEHQIYNKILIKLPYIVSTNIGQSMEILFTGASYEPQLSGDQDFTNNYVYKSENEDYLFTFGLDHLSEEELNSLKTHCEILDEKTFGAAY